MNYQTIMLIAAGLFGLWIAAPQAKKLLALLPKGSIPAFNGLPLAIGDVRTGLHEELTAEYHIHTLRIACLDLPKSDRDSGLDFCDGLETILSRPPKVLPTTSADVASAMAVVLKAAQPAGVAAAPEPVVHAQPADVAAVVAAPEVTA